MTRRVFLQHDAIKFPEGYQLNINPDNNAHQYFEIEINQFNKIFDLYLPNLTVFTMPFSELQKQYLWIVYYRQKQYQQKNKKYEATLAELKIERSVRIEDRENLLEMDASAKQLPLQLRSKEAHLSALMMKV